MRLITVCTAALLLAVTLSCAAFAAPAITVTPGSSAGTFNIQGAAMDGVAGIDLMIGYDTTILGSPSVTQGALITGALMAANANAPGTVKIAVITTRPFSGGGVIASIGFASQSGSGGITGFSASVIDSSGAKLAVATDFSTARGSSTPVASGSLSSTPGIPFSQPPTPQQTVPPAAAATATASAPVYLGTVTMPADMTSSPSPAAATPQKPVEQPAPAPRQPEAPRQEAVPAPLEKEQPAPAPAPVSPPAPAPAPQEKDELKQVALAAVADRFRTYEGEKSPMILTALFKKEVSTVIRQAPPIAVSDGTAAVTVVAELPASSSSPNVALSNARLVSIKKDESGAKWTIRVIPARDASRAAITILNGASSVEYPLTVIPPVSGMKFSDKEFETFLKDSGALRAKYDLNSDGRHDYLDDYIYTGHYLLKKGAEKRKPSDRKSRPAKK